MDCGSLTDPANGQVNHNGIVTLTIETILEQTATYGCNKGYTLVGDSTRTFQATGVWSGSVRTVQGTYVAKGDLNLFAMCIYTINITICVCTSCILS